MISILVPSRYRPDQLKAMADTALATADGDIEVIAVIDDDDSSYDDFSHPIVRIEQVERTVLSQYWNIAYSFAKGPIYMHAGDDIRFRSPHWDSYVKEDFDKYDDNLLFVYGRDGLQDEVLGTHGFLHKDWVDAVGYFVPPYFSSDYNDTWLNDIATDIGRRVYDPRIFTEHLHPSAGKGEWDKTHQERAERHSRDKVDELYASKADERLADADKLRRLL